MKKIKNIIYRFRIKLLLLRNYLYRITHSFDKSIYIVSSDKYVNRVKEDINLCYYLMKDGILTKVISYNNVSNKDNVIIRSVWGYQNDLDKFREFIINQQGVVINDKDIILSNMSKKDQYDLFVKYNIPCIDTKFIYDVNDVNINDKCVIKPIVSASGNNTFVVDKDTDINKYKDVISKGCMLQPFVDKVNDGEVSIILFNKEIMYGIKRYPGVFTKECNVSYISKDSLDKDILNIVLKVNKIKEYDNNVFMRIDILDGKVLELELLDPQLFIETINDKKYRSLIYRMFSKEIGKRL